MVVFYYFLSTSLSIYRWVCGCALLFVYVYALDKLTSFPATEWEGETKWGNGITLCSETLCFSLIHSFIISFKQDYYESCLLLSPLIGHIFPR